MKNNSNKNLKKITIVNMFWRFAERCGAQLVSFIVSIVLARLLTPDEYGLVALATVFISILQVFVDSGLGNALIQKKEADETDFSTVFYYNIVFCLIIYLIMFFCAPFIALFYEIPLLTSLVRVLSLTIIISGVKNVQQAYVSKHLMFKKFFFSTICGTIISAVIGIIMAYKGYGVWALVAQQLLNTFIDTIILWFTVKWKPKLIFSFSSLKVLWSFGWKMLLSNLINTIYNDIRQLIIGKTYSSADLAYYNKGKQFPKLIVTNVNTSIDSVLFPVMSEYQDDKQRIKTMTRRSIKTSSFFMWPVMFGLMATSKNLILLLLTEQWIPCVPYVLIFCFVYGFQPIHTANLNAIKAMGRSDLYLKMEIIKKSVGIILILITMNISVLAIGISSIAYTIFAGIVNSFPNYRLISYNIKEQLIDILPTFLLSLGMGCIVYSISYLNLNSILILIIQIFSGIAIYILGSYIFKFETFIYLLQKFFPQKKC